MAMVHKGYDVPEFGYRTTKVENTHTYGFYLNMTLDMFFFFFANWICLLLVYVLTGI